MYTLFDADGRQCKFRYPIDVKEALATGNFFRLDPTRKIKKDDYEGLKKQADAQAEIAQMEAKKEAERVTKEAKAVLNGNIDVQYEDDEEDVVSVQDVPVEDDEEDANGDDEIEEEEDIETAN